MTSRDPLCRRAARSWAGQWLQDGLSATTWTRFEIELMEIADSGSADLILTTGGTGLGPRDVTPEATTAAVEKLIPGFGEKMREVGGRAFARAYLSRATAGIRGTTMIVNLPGSPRGAVESLDAIAELLPHAAEIIRGARHD